MDGWYPLLFLAALLVPAWFALSRATDVFTLRVHQGQLRSVRGRLPLSLLGELQDVVHRAQCTGRVRVHRSRGTLLVDVSGNFTAGTVQQLRNVVGAVPMQRVLSAARVRRSGGTGERR
jgi:Protein of unknown function (DUF3634)